MERVHRSRKQYRAAAAILLAVAALLSVGASLPSFVSRAGHAAPLPPERVVEQAWQRAQGLGSYRFTTDLEATISPAGQPASTSSARHERLYIEGQVDLPAQKLAMTLWEKGGSLLRTQQGIELRVEGVKTYGRVTGGTWQEMEGVTDAFAPGQDPLAFLSAAKEIRLAGTETAQVPVAGGMAEVAYTRYAFTLDGPRFADYMRADLERRMAEKGELPPGVSLDVPEAFRGMGGQGEIWIDERGLPLRLVVDLEYPPQDGEQTRSSIQTDLAGFPAEVAKAPSIVEQPRAWTAHVAKSLGLPATARGWGDLGIQASLVAGLVGLVLIVVVRRRSRAVYVACIAVIILSMVVSPLLQSQQVQALGQRMAAQRQESQQQRAAAQLQQKMKAAQYSSDWNPLQDPLAASAALPSTGQAQGPAPTLPDAEPPVPSQPLLTFGGVQSPLTADDQPLPDSDADGDGLTYQEEMRLGTDPTLANSDLDELGDGLEVKGFDYNGQHYYTDPLSSDTINDGLVDTMECWTSPPDTLPTNSQGCNRDSDGDGNLDIFERDNDNDGVDDAVDLSPFSAMAGFSDANPFKLVVDKVQPRRLADGSLQPSPVLVDLQIQPNNPAHLAYTLSVLDWPTGDDQGQVQRMWNTTFATAANDPMTPEQIATDPRAQYGDIRLIPMLEIRVPPEGGTRNLPVVPGRTGGVGPTTPLADWLDTDKLEKYGMAAHYLDDAGRLAIYVPLNLVQDETGGSDVAFLAHFYYEPPTSGDWGQAHEMRVVWWVQMLTDQCGSGAGKGVEDDKAEATCWIEDRIETVQIVHTFPEEWSLTGLSVREDHGLEAAIAFEDPNHDTNVNDDDNLWKLANGLGDSFMAGRDMDPADGSRDVTVDEIERRWNNQTNGNNGIPEGDERLWAIPKAALQVVKRELPHKDYQITLMTETTREILNGQFLTPSGCQTSCTARAEAPTLLYATEEHARTANLDLGGTSMARAGALLTVDMDPAVVSLDTVATVSWVPYRYGAEGWEVYPLDEYAQVFDDRLAGYFPVDPTDPDSEAEARSQRVMALGYYLALTQGVAAIVQMGQTVYQASSAVKDAKILTNNFVSGFKAACKAIGTAYKATTGAFAKVSVAEQIDGLCKWIHKVMDNPETAGELGPWRAGQYKQPFYERMLAGLGVGTFIAMALVSVVFAILAVTIDWPPLTYVQNSLLAAGGTIQLVLSIRTLIQKANVENYVVSAECLKLPKDLGFKLAVVGLIIDIAAQVGLFIYEVTAGDISTGSLEFGALLSQLIANVIAAVILTVLFVIPLIGNIIWAIVQVVNAVLKIVCAALGKEFQKSEAGSWLCGGISGILAKELAETFYGVQSIADLEYEDGLQLRSPEVCLADPNRGFQAGNALAYTMQVTQTLRTASYDQIDNYLVQANYGYFLESNLEMSTFAYSLSNGKTDLHQGLSLGQETGWRDLGQSDHHEYAQLVSTAHGENIPLTSTGINRTFPTYFNEGYILPVVECWGFWFIGTISFCSIKSVADTGHAEIGHHFAYDIFPASLDAFHKLEEVAGQGYRLAWGGSSLQFPPQRDADGDGLVFGSDPGDWSPDVDGDGLSDPFELQIGTDPQLLDSDGDGLNDHEELIRGTDPNRRDTDNDGLDDKLEVTGWDFVYGWVDAHTPKIARVTSDPTLDDTDLDGVGDQKEWLYGWNPRAASEGKVLTFSSDLSERTASGEYAASDSVVRTGDQLRYEASVRNELDLRYGSGLLRSDLPAGVLSGSVDPKAFVLAPHEAATIQGDLAVQAASSGPITLTQIAGEELYDAHALSNYALLLLHLEEAAGATTFLDESGGVERHNGYCQAGHCPQTQVESVLGKGLRFSAAGQQQVVVDAVDISRGSFGVTLWISATAAATGGVLSAADGSVEIYLNNGYACGLVKTDPAVPPLCAWNSVTDGKWHQLALSYDESAAENLQFYVDGNQNDGATAPVRATPGGQAGLYLGWPPSLGAYYSGDLDEVAVYDRALDANQILAAAAADSYGFHARLDEPAGAQSFLDTNQRYHGTCGWYGCPTMGERGINRTAAKFDGSDYIKFQFGQGLGNGFTLSAWIYPETTGYSAIDGHWQGIIGAQGLEWGWDQLCRFGPYYDPMGCSFPTIERQGGCLRSGFGQGSMDSSVQIDPVCGVSPANTWQYVVVTFYNRWDEQQQHVLDAHYVLYVNGEQVGETILPGGRSPLGGGGFYVGCSRDYCSNDPARQEVIPFHGLIDDVQIYRRALYPAEVEELYEASTVTQMHLDDPPGSYLFQGTSRREPLSCPSNLAGCPTSGVAGRMNQGVLFQGVDPVTGVGDRLATETSLNLSSKSSGATLMAWVYPDSGGNQQQLVIGTDDGNPSTPEWSIWRNGGTWAVDTGNGLKTTALTVEPNRWQHIAAVFDPGKATRVYKNDGTAISLAAPTFPDHSNQVAVGCQAGAQNCFQGRIDEVEVVLEPSSDAEISWSYQAVPQFGLHLEEGVGATRFADDTQSGHDGTCSGEACPNAGVNGQVGLAAEFDGLDDGLSTTYSLSNQEATLMAWVQASSAVTFTQAVIASGGGVNLELYRKDGTWQLRSGDAVLAPAGAAVQPGEWQHLAVAITKVGTNYHLALYLNGGLLAGGLDVASFTLTNAGLGFNPDGHDEHFDGRIDEVAAYGRALSAAEIETIYDYQAGWVEEVQRTGLTIDNDLPSASLVLTRTAIPDQPIQLLIETSDPTSAVDKAQWRVNGGAWNVAPPCQGADYGSAWCPTFIPSGAGAYAIDVRATDRAGNVSPVAGAVLTGDATPPQATLSQEGTLIRLQPAVDRPNAWTAALSGAVSDAAPSSGVATVRVALIDPLGVPVGAGSQPATVGGGSWSLTYQLDEPLTTGPYTVQLEAEDQAGNHGVDRAHTIGLDRTAPEASLDGPPPGGALAVWHLEEAAGATRFVDSSGLGNDAVCNGTCPTAGAAGKYGLGVQLPAGGGKSLKAAGALAPGGTGLGLSAWFKTSAASQQTLFAATNAASGAKVVTVKLDAGGKVQYTYSPAGASSSSISTKKAYNDGAWHHLSAQWRADQIRLYLDGQVVRTAGSVEGTPPAAMNVVVGLDGGADPFSGSVDEVAIHSVWLSPAEVRSLAFTDPAKRQSEVPLQGTVSEVEAVPDAMLALHLEEAAGATSFTDSSAYDNDATCAGTGCPTVDTGGPSGAVRTFDGSDDVLSIGSSASLPYLANNLTVMAWIKPERLTGYQRVLSNKLGSPTGGIGFGTKASSPTFSTYGLKEYTATGVTLAVNQWQHIAAVMDDDNDVTFYVDGVARETVAGDLPAASCLRDMLVGRSSTAAGAAYEAFRGAIDEVYVFNRALTAEEILALGHRHNAGLASLELAYAPDLPGSPLYNAPLPQGMQLFLPFDDTPDAGGNVSFADVSGGGHSPTCTGTACPAMGQAGHAGSAALFDGVFVDVPLDVSETSYALALWFKTDCADCGIFSVYSSSDSDREVYLNGGNVCAALGVWPGVEIKCTSGTDYADGRWHQVVHTFGGSEGDQKIYIDGALKVTGTKAASDLTSQVAIGIGGYVNWANQHYFSGQLDELIVFNRALTAADVTALYVGSEPVLSLPLDEAWAVGGTTLADASGWEHDGTLTTGAGDAANKAVSGQVGVGALQFDGTDDYVEVPLDVSETSYAVSLWFKTGCANCGIFSVDYGPLGNAHDRDVYLSGGNVCAYVWSNETKCSSGTNYADGQWHHVVHTFGGSEGGQKIYVDGVLKVSGAKVASDFNWQDGINVGFARKAASVYFSGQVDDVRIYPRALSADEVQALYGTRWQAVALSQSGSQVMRSDWTATLPSGLEGHYRLDLRSTDTFDNQQARRSTWDGVLDTKAPRATLTYEGGPGTYTYRFSAQDWNLNEAALQTPCPSSTAVTRTYFNAPWYRALARVTTADSSRLYGLSGSCQLASANPGSATLIACDRYGNCTTVQATMAAGAAVEAAAAVTRQVLILDPAPGAILSSARPVAIRGVASSDLYLRRLTAEVDGVEVLRTEWAGGATTRTNWSVNWSSTDAGAHTIDAVLTDWGGGEYTHEVTFTLDTQPPSVDIATTVLTTTHALNGQLPIRGTASDENGIAKVEVRVEADGYTSDWTAAALDGDQWQALVYPGPGFQPDGELLTVRARATDRAGRVGTDRQRVTADLQLPSAVEMEISYDDESGTWPITRTGVTIPAPAPTLHLRWSGGGDGSGLAGYGAGWSVQDSSGVTQVVAYLGPGDERLVSYQATEAQRLTAGVGSRDTYGNTRLQTFGPVYIDSSLTPDYIGLDSPEGVYHGWMDDGCTLLGTDRRAERALPNNATRAHDQALYATWDRQALRLAWSGANWSGDGDLFVYLDTIPVSGTLTAMNPYTPSNTVMYLPGMTLAGPQPGAMYADYLVWVQDNQAAWLYRWDGEAWVSAAQLTPDQYRFDPDLSGGLTDLYLPFELLGVQSPISTTVSLLALATEEGALQVWAVLPQTNPVTSSFLTGQPEDPGDELQFVLGHRYQWPGLSEGVCPNGSRDLGAEQVHYTDDGLHFSVSADQPGPAYGYLGNNLAAWWGKLFGAKPAEFSSFLAMANDLERLRDGQEITYTVQYRNDGAETAHGVVLQVRSRLALTLPGGAPQTGQEHVYYQEVPIGDVAPGQTGTVTFRGQVNLAWAQQGYDACLAQYPTHPLACAFHKRWALLGIQVYDASRLEGEGPREWMWVDHRVDSEPPAFAGFLQAGYQLSATRNNALQGYAYDESGVVAVTLEIQAPDGDTRQVRCTNPDPGNGQWSCGLNLAETAEAVTTNGAVPADGDTYRIRLRAEDGVGLVSDWSPWRTFVVDRTPPEVTTTSSLTGTLGGLPLSLGSLSLDGAVQDNYGLRGVEVCLDGQCQAAATRLAAPEWSYQDTPAEPIAIGACDGAELVREFSVGEDSTVGEVRLGFEAEIADRDRLQVTLTSPAGTSWELVEDDYDTSTNYANWNVVLADRAVAGLHDLRADGLLTTPGLGEAVRPLQALDVFRGEPTAGTWRLSLCDTGSGGEPGLYHGAQLWIDPPNTAPLSGTWRATQQFGPLDDVEQTVEVYGIDGAGNRSSEPQVVTFRVDNVTPVLTVTEVITQVAMRADLAPVTVLAGQASDGGKVVRMHAYVRDPEGYGASGRPVVSDGGNWQYDLQPVMAGSYRVWVAAEDEAGNQTTVGPFVVEVTGIRPSVAVTLYLPLVLKGASGPEAAPEPAGLPTATVAVTPTATITPTATMTLTATVTPMVTPTLTLTPTPPPTEATPTPTEAITPTLTPVPTVTVTVMSTETVTPIATAASTVTVTVTVTP